MRQHIVGRNTETLVVHQPEEMLRRCVALLGGAAIPVGGERVVLRYAAPGRVHEAELRLRARIAALGRSDHHRHGLRRPHGAESPAVELGGVRGRASKQREDRQGEE